MTTSHLRLQIRDPGGSATVERLWQALAHARAGEHGRHIADLEDAAFRLYLPMARTLARGVKCDTSAERLAAEQAAELGLAQAVLEWRLPTSKGFQRFARAAMLRQLLNR